MVVVVLVQEDVVPLVDLYSCVRQVMAKLQSVVTVSASAMHSLAVTESGAVWSWGRGAHGRLGHANGEKQSLPQIIAV